MINHEMMTGGGSMNDMPDFSADILSSIDKQEKVEHQKLLETIEKARADGKEDFDPNVFSKLYWRQGLMRDGMENAMYSRILYGQSGRDDNERLCREA